MQSKIPPFLLLSAVLPLFFSGCTLLSAKLEKHPLAQFPVNRTWEKRDRRYPIIYANLPVQLPPSLQLEYRLPVGNQGLQASGTAWSVATASSHYFHNKGVEHYRCSAAFLYNSLNHGKNAGIEIFEALELHRETGCPDESLMPYRPNDYSYHPTPNALEMAQQFQIDGFGRIEFYDINQVKGHLFQKSVVIATLQVYENFLKLKKETWIPMGKPVGRHTISVVGYDDTRQAFLIQNSAGTGWGDAGYAWIPYDWFIRLVDSAYVIL